MIPHRFARLLGAVLLLAPSLALAQSSLQQPGAKDPIPVAISKLYANDLFLQNLIAVRFNTLGAAALLNVGTVTGTVADGGALAAEILRAKAAEQANAASIATNTSAISNETSRAQGVEALKAPIASPAFTGTPTVPTAAAGTSTTQAASTAFVATAVAAGGGSGSAGVPPSRQILTSGLATGGGDLTADRTITVPAAAQSDVATGTDQTKALTSFSVAAALGAKAPLASPALVGTPTAPTAAAGTSTTQLATTAYADRSASNVRLIPFRNRLINGNFAINQRGAASASTAYSAGAYVMDRWKAGANGVTLSFSAAASGDVTVSITAGTLVQVIEGSLYLPEGGAYTLSWSGTATARIYQSTATGSYAAAPLVATGLTPGTNTTVEFSTGTLALAQFEPGSQATVFERRDDEMRRAQRYYWAPGFPDSLTGYAGAAGGGVPTYLTFPVKMRIVPIATATYANGFNVGSTATNATTDAGRFVLVGAAAGYLYATVSNISFNAEL